MSDIKPVLTPAKRRKELVKNGLIEECKKNRSIYVSVTEKGWHWGNENLDASFSKGSNASKFALMELLPKLKYFMKSNDISLFEILCSPESAQITFDEDTYENKIREAYFRASGSQWNVRVRLYDLRKELPEIEKKNLDEMLLKMQNEGKLVLYKMDDVNKITDEDRDAAVHIGEFKRHILYMEK